MDAKNINFGNELCVNLVSQRPLPIEFEENVVDFEILNDGIYIKYGSDYIRLYSSSVYHEDTIQYIKQYKDRTLMRVDKINGNNIFISFIIFPKVINFVNNEEFIIAIDQAVEFDLRRRDIKEDVNEFFNRQFILDHKCFALADPGLNVLTLIGNDYFCKVEKTLQNYLHVIELRRKRRNQRISGEVMLLKGNISFVDELSDKCRLTDEVNKRFYEAAGGTYSLMDLWSLYNELELEAAEQEIEEMGFVRYDSYSLISSIDNENKYIFKLCDEVKKEFLTSSLGYAVVSEYNFDKNEPINSKGCIFLGDKIEVGHDKKEIAIYCRAEDVYLPDKGYIMGAYGGSFVMKQRREEAQLKIECCKTPLLSLKSLLQTGTSSAIPGKRYRPIDDDLLKKIFGTKNNRFTERQIEAIDIAINTPDIALIQGPPGTGKTTIIRAIIARLEKIYEGKIKILVSSSQHDSVDNIIEGVQYAGLPANRLGGRAGASETSTNQYMWRWIDELIGKCDDFLEQEVQNNERSIFRRIYTKIEECRKHILDIEFVKNELLDIYSLLLSTNLDRQICDMVYVVLGKISSIKTERLPTYIDQIVVDELKKMIELQRIDRMSFLNDGVAQLSRLIAFIKLHDEIDFEIPQLWLRLRRFKPAEDDIKNLDLLLDEFKRSLEELTNKVFMSNAQLSGEVLSEKEKNEINDLFDNIIEAIHEYGKTYEEKIADIIWEFRDELNDPQNIKDIIYKYNRLNAATCQQVVSKKASSSMILDYVVKSDIYDYVIIDEAARANPLDLLIPMSIGKKIILVGDHKQLPHLLEKDIVEKIVEQKGDKRVEDLLKESLFSRLYNMLDKSKYTGIKRTVMLKEQYRMHPTIGKFVSRFYDEKIVSVTTAESRSHGLNLYNNKPIAWINVPRKEGMELSTDTYSKCREAEKRRVMQELFKILKANEQYSIGIITFYKRQSMLIQEEVSKLSLQDQKRILVGTVDAFQGREFDIVILSTVRSNTYVDKRQRVGFLDSPNRLCVAFSRAKRLLIVIGDYETVAQEGNTVYVKELKDFYELCREEGYCE